MARNKFIDRIEFAALIKDTEAILDYIEKEEHGHYIESGRPANHIYVNIKTLREWLKRHPA